jgi:hypothetical protein
MISIVADRLCGSIPMITRATPLLLDQTPADIGERQRYFELGRPLTCLMRSDAMGLQPVA